MKKHTRRSVCESYVRVSALGAPFAFATGYGAQGVDRKYADVPRLTKPFLRADLERPLSQIRRAVR